VLEAANLPHPYLARVILNVCRDEDASIILPEIKMLLARFLAHKSWKGARKPAITDRHGGTGAQHLVETVLSPPRRSRPNAAADAATAAVPPRESEG